MMVSFCDVFFPRNVLDEKRSGTELNQFLRVFLPTLLSARLRFLWVVDFKVPNIVT